MAPVHVLSRRVDWESLVRAAAAVVGCCSKATEGETADGYSKGGSLMTCPLK